ncbi:hypothetical protein SKAU_G00403710, partial [Synaphobranchus kaupii]
LCEVNRCASLFYLVVVVYRAIKNHVCVESIHPTPNPTIPSEQSPFPQRVERANDDKMKRYFPVLNQSKGEEVQNQTPKRAREEPLPNEKSKTSETREKIYRYNPEWKKDFPWLTYDEEVMKMNVAYCIAKEELPFNKFKPLILLCKKNGADISPSYDNHVRCGEMIETIAD